MEIFKKNKIENSQYFTILICILFITACNNEINTASKKATKSISNVFSKDIIDTKTVATNVLSLLNTNKTGYVFEKDSVKNVQEIIDLYTNNKNEPLWLSNTGVNDNATVLLEKLASLKDEGINPEKYHISYFKKLIETIKSNPSSKPVMDSACQNLELGLSNISIKASKDVLLGGYTIANLYEDNFNKNDSNFVASKYVSKLANADSMQYIFSNLLPKNKVYEALKNKLKKLESIKAKGAWTTNFEVMDSLKMGSNSNAIKALRKRLFTEIGEPKDIENVAFSSDLQGALLVFQHLHDLRPTGNVDTATKRWLNTSVDTKIKIVKTNMERIRWLNKDMPQPYVWVNIPSMELKFIEKDSTAFKMRVVVGRVDRETPPLDATMTNVVINPNWSVPPTIMKEEVVPGIARRGGGYLARRGLKAYLHGHQVSASMINSSNYRRFSIQQNPGLNSSLGAVKFNLPNPHAIYLHDTPHRCDFVKYYRAYSSGCIRVEKPREFAEFVLQDSNYTKPKIDSLIKRKSTIQVPLKKNIDVHIVYLTNGLDSLGNVQYLRDIYKKDGVMNALWN